jgi:hypothetical protein
MTRKNACLAILGLLLLSGCTLFTPPSMELGILFEDSFDESITDWPTYENVNQRWWIEGGHYNVLVKTPHQSMTSWRTQVGSFGNFRLELEAEQVSGPDNNAYGVLFRVIDDDNYYCFYITGDSYVGLKKKVAGQFVVLFPELLSYFVHWGNDVNLLAVIADGDQLEFFVNGESHFTITDTAFAAGGIGMMAEMRTTPGQTHIAFDNMVLHELP